MSNFKADIDGALNKPGSKYFAQTQIFLASVVVISITSIILETVHTLNDSYHAVFIFIEWATVAVFSLEYIARLWVSKKKTSYIFSFWGIIDAISILPTYASGINLTFLKSFRDLRILRMLRVARLAKISRTYVVSKDKAETEADFNKMNITIYFMALFSTMIIFASLLYAFDAGTYAYSNIPLAMIQSAKILVGGLGQAATTTLAGEITVIIERFVGLALFGLLIAIIGGVLKQVLFGDIEKK